MITLDKSGYTSDKAAVRKIRDGKVKIGGVWFYPGVHPGAMNGARWIPARPYDGRLENTIQLFCRYHHWGTDDKQRYEPFVSLWADSDSPSVVDGVFEWQFWYPSIDYMRQLVDNETNEDLKWHWNLKLEDMLEAQQLVAAELATE